MGRPETPIEERKVRVHVTLDPDINKVSEFFGHSVFLTTAARHYMKSKAFKKETKKYGSYPG